MTLSSQTNFHLSAARTLDREAAARIPPRHRRALAVDPAKKSAASLKQLTETLEKLRASESPSSFPSGRPSLVLWPIHAQRDCPP